MTMSKTTRSESDLDQISRQCEHLLHSISRIDRESNSGTPDTAKEKLFVDVSGKLVEELQRLRENISPGRFGTIGITLGRSDGIAKFFAFSFVNQDKRKLSDLRANPFYGSGVYAIYYHGKSVKAYSPLSCTETPIYVGKADPQNDGAETIEAQGQALYGRLKEHANSIEKTDLNPSDFHYRYATIQSGMQSAVEEFMIRLFRPIWNKQVNICYGIGKHGDKATTRANKRSPWDTMHPGRKWAKDTTADQVPRAEVEVQIAGHFHKNQVISNKEALFKLLSLG